jgi:cell division protease FtsH
MSDRSTTAPSQPEPHETGQARSSSPWLSFKKAAARLQDWFTIQSIGIKLLVLGMAILIPVTAAYSWSVLQRQQQIAEQVKEMAAGTGEGVWTYNKQLPVVFGTGSVLSFLEQNGADRITVIYTPFSWNVSERYILIESKGKVAS